MRSSGASMISQRSVKYAIWNAFGCPWRPQQACLKVYIFSWPVSHRVWLPPARARRDICTSAEDASHTEPGQVISPTHTHTHAHTYAHTHTHTNTWLNTHT